MEQNKAFNMFNIPIEEQKQKQENRNRDHIIDLLTELNLGWMDSLSRLD